MKILSLKNGQLLGCTVYEVDEIPPSRSIHENEEYAQQKNETEFFNMLTEVYRFCQSNRAVLEILWVKDRQQSQTKISRLRIFVVLRLIEASISELESKMQMLVEGVLLHMKNGKFRFSCIEADNLKESGILPSKNESIKAIVKSEQYIVHTQSLIPYYFSFPMTAHGIGSYASISKSMADASNCAVSMQLIPTSYSSQERVALVEMQSLLSQMVNGVTTLQGVYRDSSAEPAFKAMRYINDQLFLPTYTYNLLVFGEQRTCSLLATQLISIINNGSNNEYSVVDLKSDEVSACDQFEYYPWGINKKLVYEYRNHQLWNKGVVPKALFRIPYLLSAEEATSFFRLPIAEKGMVGLRERTIVDEMHQFIDEAVSQENIKFGSVLDQETVILGCPPETLTKHMFVVGKPGTGKTTFSINLLLQMAQKNIPFLAIEPTKAEYRALLEAIPDLQIFTPGNNRVSPFVINPFIPPKGITVEQYIPSLVSAFKAAFSMPSPLDAVFQEAIQEAYVQYGWRDYSTIDDENIKRFGLFEFILVFKRLISKKGYSGEVKGNLESGGVLRLRNLIEQNANIYDTVHSVPIEDLLSHPSVIELNSIENREQKAILMALLLINICVYTAAAFMPLTSSTWRRRISSSTPSMRCSSM